MSLKQHIKKSERITIPVLFVGTLLYCSACGNADGNIYLPFDINALSDTENNMNSDPAEQKTGNDTVSNSGDSNINENPTDNIEDCRAVQWGTSCKIGNRIYNLTFTGIEASTKKEVDISFEDLHCMGYNSAIIVAGDAQCTACPSWYSAVGARIDDIHNANSVLIAVSTDNLGLDDLSDAEALQETETMQPDFAIGSDPFVYPCRYSFTPYTMVVNLRNGTIMDMDSVTYKLSVNTMLKLINQANSNE